MVAWAEVLVSVQAADGDAFELFVKEFNGLYSTFACAQVVGFEVIRLYGYSEITIIHLN